MKALLVAIDQYETISSLAGCANDVTNVRDTLMSHAGLSSSDFRVLLNEQATAANIRKGLEDLAAGAAKGESHWFYFAGHGAQLVATDPNSNEPDGLDEVLCPHDFNWTSASAIRDDEIVQCLNAFPATSDLIVGLDCCHSGDYVRGSVRTPRRVPAAVANARRSGVSRYRSIRSAGLSSNCLVISACRPTQLAHESTNADGKPCGAFTNAFFAHVNASPLESVRSAVEAAAAALSKFPQKPVMEGSDRLRDRSYVAKTRGLGSRNVLRSRSGQVLWSQEWRFNASASGGTAGARLNLVDANFWLETYVDMFGIHPTISVPLGDDVDETIPIAYGFSLTVGARNFSLEHGRLSFQLNIGVKPPISFIPMVTVVDTPVSVAVASLSRSTAAIGSLADLAAFQAMQEPKAPAASSSPPARTREAGSTRVEFRQFRCITAEAMFGDTIEIFYENETVLSPTAVNSGTSVALRSAVRTIPEGGGSIQIWQSYFGQPAEKIKDVVITRDMLPGEMQIEMLEREDGDPGGRYYLGIQLMP